METKSEIKTFSITVEEINNIMNLLNILPVASYEATMAKASIYKIIEQIASKNKNMQYTE